MLVEAELLLLNEVVSVLLLVLPRDDGELALLAPYAFEPLVEPAMLPDVFAAPEALVL